MTPPAPTGRSAFFWIAVVAGGGCALCGLSTVGLMALGLVADDEPGAAPAPAAAAGSGSGSSEWVPTGEVGRSAGLTRPLPGGRWLYQYGSGFDTVIAKSGNMALLRANSSGGLYEFTFDEGGTYHLAWRHSTSLNGINTLSSVDERGEWTLAGTTLTLAPDSQRLHYANNQATQDEEDKDLSARVYQVVDVELEVVEHTGAAMRRLPGLEVRGPPATWDLNGSQRDLDLQRLTP